MDEDRYEVVKELILQMVETAKDTIIKKYASVDSNETVDVINHLINQINSLYLEV